MMLACVFVRWLFGDICIQGRVTSGKARKHATIFSCECPIIRIIVLSFFTATAYLSIALLHASTLQTVVSQMCWFWMQQAIHILVMPYTESLRGYLCKRKLVGNPTPWKYCDEIIKHENFQIYSFHGQSKRISMLLADHNMTTEVPTGDGLMASEIFTPEVLYSSVIHNLEYHLPILVRTLPSLGKETLHHSGSNIAGTLG